MLHLVFLIHALLPLAPARQDSRTVLEHVEALRESGVAPELFLEETLLEHKLEGAHELVLNKLRALRLLMGTQGKEPDLAWLTRVTSAQVELLLDLGRHEEAAQALDHPLPSEQELAGLPGLRRSLNADTDAGRSLTRRWLESEPARALRQRLERERHAGDLPIYAQANLEPWAIAWLRREVGLPSQEMVEAATRLLQSDTESTAAVWTRFLPSLAVLALMEVQGRDSGLAFDAYGTLVYFDSAVASGLTLAALPHGTPGWRRRVIEHLPIQSANALWISSSVTYRRHYHQPLWVDVLAMLLEERPDDPELRSNLRTVLQQRGVVERLEDVLRGFLRSRTLSELELLFADLSHGSPYSLTGVYSAGFANPDEGVRRHCMYVLSDAGLFEPLIEPVREGLAEATSFFLAACRETESSGWRASEPAVDVLSSLLVGPDPELARQAASLVRGGKGGSGPRRLLEAGLESPHVAARVDVARAVMSTRGLPDALYVRVAEDDAAAVRSEFLTLIEVRVHVGGLDLLASVLSELIEDPSPEVRALLDELLQRMVTNTIHARDGRVPRQVGFELLLERARRGAGPWEPRSEGEDAWEGLRGELPQEESSSVFLLRVGAAQGVAEAVNEGLDGLYKRREIHAVRSLSPEELGEVLRAADRHYLGGGGRSGQDLREVDWTGFERALEGLALDESVDPYRRLWAMDELGVALGTEMSDALLALLRRPEWADGRWSLSDLIQGRWPRIGEGGNALLRTVLESEEYPRSIQETATRWFTPATQDAWPTAELVFQRYFESEESFQRGIGDVLGALEELAPTPPMTQTLVRFLGSRHLDFVETAARLLRGHRSPEAVPALGAVLLRNDASNQAGVQRAVTEALVASGSPEALPYLRAGLLTAASSSVADGMRSGIERIEEYLVHIESPSGGLPARPAAEAKLVAMLDSSSEPIRIEAIRGLGTLGAVEALPLLIPLLEDESEPVRSAVRESLDRLHAARSKE